MSHADQTKDTDAKGGYEARDASFGWIVATVVILAVSGLVIHFFLAGFMTVLKRSPEPADQWQAVARPAGGVVSPPGGYPKLQVSPAYDWEAFKAREEAWLNSYGWVNQPSGIVHIPISVAMDLVLQKGLPMRQPGSNQAGLSSYQLQIERVEQRPKTGGAQQ